MTAPQSALLAQQRVQQEAHKANVDLAKDRKNRGTTATQYATATTPVL